MKYLTSFVIAVTLLLHLRVNGQIVPSFCNGPSSLQAQYEVDAWYVAFDYLLKADSAKWSETIFIPNNVKDSVLQSILGVYNADLPARDTVIDQFSIHKFKQDDLRRFDLFLDTSHLWVRNFVNGDVTNTTNPFVDSLAMVLGFEIETLNWLPSWVQGYQVLAIVKCNTYINTNYLAKVMASYSGVSSARPHAFGGDGNHIFYESKADYDEVTFRRGWGDCPAGCLYQRDWLFRVYHDDCSVEFVSSYGDLLDFTSTNGVKTSEPLISVFPNPSLDEMKVDIRNLRFNNDVSIVVRDLMGRTVISYESPVYNGHLSTILDIQNVLRGTYFLTVYDNGRALIRKTIVKM